MVLMITKKGENGMTYRIFGALFLLYALGWSIWVSW